MQMILNEEMLEKVTCVAYGRIRDLRRKIAEANSEEVKNDRESARKKILLNDLQKSLKNAEEVHAMFFIELEKIRRN